MPDLGSYISKFIFMKAKIQSTWEQGLGIFCICVLLYINSMLRKNIVDGMYHNKLPKMMSASFADVNKEAEIKIMWLADIALRTLTELVLSREFQVSVHHFDAWCFRAGLQVLHLHSYFEAGSSLAFLSVAATCVCVWTEWGCRLLDSKKGQCLLLSNSDLNQKVRAPFLINYKVSEEESKCKNPGVVNVNFVTKCTLFLCNVLGFGFT